MSVIELLCISDILRVFPVRLL